ncbi:MAG: hypothetical protein C0602_00385 [Denitrovibrio sp.]|nr:MAG: hypothetical protein C0602_00385 [Denitrovibrio sp.]
MKILKFIFIAACFFSLSACVGGGSAKPSVSDDTSVVNEFTVPQSGTITYTGTGDFEGFSISVSDAALAGRTIYIEKVEPDYNIDGYKSLSDIYAVRLKDSARDASSSALYTANVTLPYSSSILNGEGGNSGDVFLCSESSGSATKYTTTPGSGAYISAQAVFPGRFFAGYLDSSISNDSNGLILLKGISYKEAKNSGNLLQDPAGVFHPDVVRGTQFVQPGERVLLGVNEEAFADEVLTSSWQLTSIPTGSAAELTITGDDAFLTPDITGVFEVTLDITGINGFVGEQRMKIFAKPYLDSFGTGEPLCYTGCHSGGITDSVLDDYGRPLFRDIATPWRNSAHAGAFTSVAAETDSTCFKCHTTGFLFADRNSDGADEYSYAKGYDDSISDWAAPNGGESHLRGVACEACHGPGSSVSANDGFIASHYKNTPITSYACLTCHDNSDVTFAGHTFEYSTSHDNAHTLAGGNVAKNASCFKCHTGQGALSKIYDADVTPANTDTVSGVGCVVCHDPHDEDGNYASLRVTGNYNISLSTGVHTVDAGKGLVCYNCHNTDSNPDSPLPAVGTIPHNAQAELYQGVGGYSYGELSKPAKSIHTFFPLSCNDCHLKKDTGVTHNLQMSDDSDSRIAVCTDSCHSVAAPTFENGHYEYQGRLAELRSLIQSLKETINAKAGLALTTTIKASYTSDVDGLAEALNRAAYNYNFIKADRSNGLHNPTYARNLIELSLADLGNY